MQVVIFRDYCRHSAAPKNLHICHEPLTVLIVTDYGGGLKSLSEAEINRFANPKNHMNIKEAR